MHYVRWTDGDSPLIYGEGIVPDDYENLYSFSDDELMYKEGYILKMGKDGRLYYDKDPGYNWNLKAFIEGINSI